MAETPLPDWTEDLTACAGIVERADPDRFRQAMAAPLAVRHALFPLYAFNIEVARAPWVTQEPMIAEMRLQWWRDALDEIAREGRDGTAIRRHEVVTPLALSLPTHATPWLDALIDARRWDIWKEPFADEAHFRAYLDATSGHLLRAGALMLGDPLEESLASDAGFAIGLANWFAAIPELEASGRQPLPDGRPETVANLAREGLEAITRARTRRTQIASTQAALFFGLPESATLLTRAARNPAAVKSGTLAPTPLRARFDLTRAALLGRW
ncbi:squalene/phytoene synthase family protein [Pseudooceanicola algae]|uniref:Uncharacterized protein n=1 Tax=Pseudooceanicola algae TaxID=1537215 RepID=A0A418SBW8_9RHOB|nr:squalene/phytoene synthase family protein [Pseudooceanicola algae]QPM89900.1 hypothetical protein PSAL_011290 [Pseudooceanicola algae]